MESLHVRLIDELRSMAGRRKRLLAAECDDALLEVAPQMRYDPERRRRLRELLAELDEIGALAWSVSRDRSVRPELPTFVTLAEPSEGAELAIPVAQIPWRPELEWAYRLPLTPGEQEVLTVIQTYRRDRGSLTESIPHRERSLQLFGDEKRIDRLFRGRLFNQGRLSLEMLDCFWAAPPIAWTDTGGEGPVVVSENSASYRTLVDALQGRARAVAYGGGGAFAQSVVSLSAIEGLSAVLYVGDLDAEGLAIPQRAAAAADAARIPLPAPDERLWSALVAAREYHQSVPPVPTEVAGELCEWFGSSTLRVEVARLLEADIRVPQEALTAERLRSLHLDSYFQEP